MFRRLQRATPASTNARLAKLAASRYYIPEMAPLLLPAAERLGRHALVRRGARSLWYPTRRGHIHYYDVPGLGNLPTVVLLHGLGTAATAFAGLLGGLRPHFRRLVAPDHLGHGFSSGPERALTPDHVLDATSEALLGILTEPALLVGNSMGGALALKFALAHPDKVRGLLLVSPAGAPFADTEWQELRDVFELTSRRDAMRLFHRIYRHPPWLLRLMAHEMTEHFRRPAVRSLLAGSATSALVTPAELQTLAMPVMLLWGRADGLLPRTQLAYFRENLPHARIEEPQFGHSPHLDATLALRDYVVGFAESVTTPNGSGA